MYQYLRRVILKDTLNALKLWKEIYHQLRNNKMKSKWTEVQFSS
jgi:hypothetical protein